MSEPESPPRAWAAPTIARAALLVAVLAVLARLAGFARILVFAHTVGPSCLGDTYYTANTIPNILFDVVAGGALSSLVVPILAGPVDSGDGETADRVVSALLTWTGLLMLPVLVGGLLLAHPLMSVLVGNGHPGCPAAAEIAVGTRMLRVFMPQVLFYGAGVVCIGVLQAHRRFTGPAIAPLLSSLAVIAAYLVFATAAERRETSLSTLSRSHELVLSVGTTLGVVLLAATLVLPLRRTGRRIRPTLGFPPGLGATARRMAMAGAVVLGSQDVATAVILRLANDRGADGAVVLYNLAWTVFLVPWSVLAVPLATAAFPTLTARWHAGERAAYAATTARTARGVTVVTAGAAGLLVAAAVPLARVVVLGAPGAVPPVTLARALAAFAPGLLGYGAIALFTRAHYARGDARTPAVAAAAGWGVAIVADVVLAAAMPRQWTATALGLGGSLGMTLAGAWLFVSQRRAVGTISVAGLRRTAPVAILAAIGIGVAGYAVTRAVPHSGVGGSAALALAIGLAGGAAYLGLIWWLDRPSVELLLRRGRGSAIDG
ncbi:MAG: hypothetical protein JO222_10905 [Frankiales bacterium]|nr:hypothetical protein [Frankiales bacterium]